MSDTQQIQELTESIAISAMNGGELFGMVFRHDDSGQKRKKEMIHVKAGEPTLMLYGVKPWRMEVEITMQSDKSARLAAIYGAALARLTDPQILRAAKIAAGLPDGVGNVDIYFESMSGDRSDSQKLRKRTITIPFEVKAD